MTEKLQVGDIIFEGDRRVAEIVEVPETEEAFANLDASGRLKDRAFISGRNLRDIESLRERVDLKVAYLLESTEDES